MIDVPTAFVNITANHLPNILLSSLFSVQSAGYYYLTQRVLQAPVTLISKSILDVFKQKASMDYNEFSNCRIIFKKTFYLLILLALPMGITLYFFIEDLIVLIFGESWCEAGVIAKMLIPALTLRFIANPLSFVIYIADKQFLNFLTMIALLIGVLISLFYNQTFQSAVCGISLTYCVYYSLHIILSFKLAKVF